MSTSSPAPTVHTLRCLGPAGFHTMAYAEWPGPPGAPTVVCVHGLTRNGRDFDTIAKSLQKRFRVICPDIVGRGNSDWLADPQGYSFPTYIADLCVLLAAIGQPVAWLGTSMGGMIGMMLAAQPGTPIRCLIVNDVGPVIPRAAFERMATYVQHRPTFDAIEHAESYLRKVHAGFGPLSDAQWRRLAVNGTSRRPDGGLRLNYDPAISQAFIGAPACELSLWDVWDAIKCPVLALRGRESDLLRADDASRMTRRGPPCQVIEFPGVGHAPALMARNQIAAVNQFLAA